MKTYDLAKALEQLAKALKNAPNIELSELNFVSRESVSSDRIALNLDNLVSLSRIDKQQWLNFVQENNFKISIRPRDASTDILAKILRFLDKNPPEREKLKKKFEKNNTESPELMKALDFLLKK